jgi:hypothetical protein
MIGLMGQELKVGGIKKKLKKINYDNIINWCIFGTRSISLVLDYRY